MTDIAVVGMSCCYPDARSPQELWENVLAQRQAFRRFPPERLRLADHYNPDASAPDTTYGSQGAFLTNYEFDRVRFRISGSTYRASDLTHWLALDVATQALADAGFLTAESMPGVTTRVIVGNTLTGEFARANALRLRWPYVRRVVEASLREVGWNTQQCASFLRKLESSYKAPFAPIGEETLAGGLSNTIAGRICNYFHFNGGGYTVDGACASSLLAIATACTALADGEADLALAGGVDLSLDPFELVGFAKTAALAPAEMRVYDQDSHGFIPGEGCGFVVLMRYEDALAQQRRVYALVRGWGISSDGGGGITRPEVGGQLLALTRAYQKAGLDIASVEYFEGHGTGTSVGDQTELQTVTRARQEAQAAGVSAQPATIGSIKANIGHTKAAAGVAGFIKAVMTLSTQILPPQAGTRKPHPELLNPQAALQIRHTGTIWPPDRPLRAGVSAMGFGGINTHLVLEGMGSRRRDHLTNSERTLLASAQDEEFFLLAAQDRGDLRLQVAHLLTFADRLSRAELTDLAQHLARNLKPGNARAALLATKPTELSARLERLLALLDGPEQLVLDEQNHVFLGYGQKPPRVGFLFPGQGSPAYLQDGLLRKRFGFVRELYNRSGLATTGDGQDTGIAQPAIVTASMAALRVLQRLGIQAEAGLGHSLGELTALHWAGAIDEAGLLELARVRGAAMASLGDPTGTMIGLLAPQETVEELIEGEEVVIAGFNTPRQVVLSGSATAIAAVSARARARQINVIPLKVSHAFHSPLVSAAALPLADYLSGISFQALQRPVFSTVTGAQLAPEHDLKDLLFQQITRPVRFTDALKAATDRVDLLIEVGPGKVLTGLAREWTSIPAFALDVDGPSSRGLCQTIGAAFAAGVPLRLELLTESRFSRPFDLNWQPRFLANPCEQAPLPATEGHAPSSAEAAAQTLLVTPEEVRQSEEESSSATTAGAAQTETVSILELLRQLVAERTELPRQAVDNDHRMLNDLHLNSITVGQIVSEAARSLGLLPPTALTEYADATLAEIAQALTELKQTGGTLELEERMKMPTGVDTWIRAFQVGLQATPNLAYVPQTDGPPSTWKVLAPRDYSLAEALRAACPRLSRGGVLVCLPPQPTTEQVALLLYGAQEMLKSSESSCFVLVHHGQGGGGVARTLALEAPKHTICVVDVPPTHPQAVAWTLAEIQAAQGYSEAVYTEHGQRYVKFLQHVPLTSEQIAPLALGPDDVLLVTGGGKGIAAECAYALARETGVRLALLGRSQPARDSELAENLQRFSKAGITFRYVKADVTDAAEVEAALEEITRALGSITALVHGAGKNTPRPLSALTEDDFRQTLGPKVTGLEHILARLALEKLRLLVTFGSVIARTGMRGEADYALANDWLAELTERFQQEHPTCRCLCLEWSVWAGVGMGERLGRVEALMREGIMPISIDKGIACFQAMLNYRLPAVRVVLTNRFGSIPTLQMPAPELPFLRFLEHPRIFYPGIELVTDVEISTATDPYTEEHKFRGERLLPAVAGLEAMAQIALAVTGQTRPPRFEHVQLTRPIVIPERHALKVRIAALVTESGEVDVVIRSEETGFQIDHFRATCCFAERSLEPLPQLADFSAPALERRQRIPLEPVQDLYGSVLFHEGRFQRVQGYLHLRATECMAELLSPIDETLFARYLPPELVLGNFITRDAVIHCIQACIPHGRLLPVAVDELSFAPAPRLSDSTCLVYARERSRVGDLFTYDVEVRTPQGQMLEQWRGLQFLQVEAIPAPGRWNEALLGPYIERKFNEFLPAASLHLVLQRSADADREGRSDQAFQHLLTTPYLVHKRQDGKPMLLDARAPALSASHQNYLTCAVTGVRAVGCDIEAIVPRATRTWQDLLGPERMQLATFLAAQTGEDMDTIGTRLWAASECLKKAGALVNVSLRFGARKDDGWLLLKAGLLLISSYVARVHSEKNPLVFAICSAVENNQEMERAIRRSLLAEKEKHGAGL